MWMNASFISFWDGVGLKYLFSELLMEEVTGTKVLRYWLNCHEISFKFMYWQNLSSICLLAEILCPAFQNFENGVATHATTPIAETSGVPLHSIVYFTCIGGFRLSSDVILTCLFNGSWSESPPICLGAHWTKFYTLFTLFWIVLFLIEDEIVRVTKNESVHLEYH